MSRHITIKRYIKIVRRYLQEGTEKWHRYPQDTYILFGLFPAEMWRQRMVQVEGKMTKNNELRMMTVMIVNHHCHHIALLAIPCRKNSLALLLNCSPHPPDWSAMQRSRQLLTKQPCHRPGREYTQGSAPVANTHHH